MALTADQLNTIYNNVLFRNVDAGGIQFFANRTDISDAQVRQQIELSPEATTYVSPIVRLYQAEFGRVPDVGGLKFFVQSYEQGGGTQNISVIAQQLLNSAEATSGGTTAGNVLNAGFVSTIYNNILGRTASTGEVNFWTGSGKTAAVVLAEITNSNESAQRNASGVVTFLDSAAVGSANGGSLGSQTTATGGATSGSTFTFAVNTPFETLNGTGGNDTFNGLAADVQTTDTVNGGVGTDVVQIFGSTGGGATTIVPTLNGVEQLIFVAPITGTVTADLSNVTGLQNVNFKNSTVGGALTVKADVAVGYDNVTGGVAETITTATAATSQTVYLANGSTLGTLTLANSTGSALTSARIDSAGTTANTIGSIAVDANLKTLNITGAQKLTITAALDSDITTVNASTDTGGVTLLANTTNLTVTGGSGSDKFAFAGNLDTNDTVVGGTGTDTIAITGVNLTAGGSVAQLNALNTKVTGVEVLEFTDGTAAVIQGGTGTGAFTNTEITKLLFNTTDVGTDTITQAGSARTYAFGELNTGDAAFTLSANANTINISLEGIVGTGAGASGDVGALAVNLDAGAVTGTTATINLASTGPGTVANTTGVITAVSGSTYNITGSHDLTITSLANGGTVNASAFTGKLTLTTSGVNDSITTGSGGSTITAGAGVDTINFSASTGAADVHVISGIVASANRDTVTGFTAGTANGADVIRFADTDTTHSGSGVAAIQSVTAAPTAAVTFNTTDNDVLSLNFNLTGTTLGNGTANSLDGTNLLAAINQTLSVSATTNTGYIAAYQNGNAYLYHVIEAVGDGDATVAAADIALVGTYNNVAVGGLVAQNFNILAVI